MVDVKLGNNPLESQSTIQSGPIGQASAIGPQGQVSSGIAYGTVVSANLSSGVPIDLAGPPALYLLDPPPGVGLLRSIAGNADQYGTGRGQMGTIFNNSSSATPLTIQNNTPDVLTGSQRKVLTHTGADFVLAVGKSATVIHDTINNVYRIIGVT